jgi:hypothetical protein
MTSFNSLDFFSFLALDYVRVLSFIWFACGRLGTRNVGSRSYTQTVGLRTKIMLVKLYAIEDPSAGG